MIPRVTLVVNSFLSCHRLFAIDLMKCCLSPGKNMGSM